MSKNYSKLSLNRLAKVSKGLFRVGVEDKDNGFALLTDAGGDKNTAKVDLARDVQHRGTVSRNNSNEAGDEDTTNEGSSNSITSVQASLNLTSAMQVTLSHCLLEFFTPLRIEFNQKILSAPFSMERLLINKNKPQKVKRGCFMVRPIPFHDVQKLQNSNIWKD